ncbi:MAG: hypothetical protein JWM80_5922 [Cyanobacteria bacterium RYN_339]|nr:hypothetical protein [Cyanobacteria bacterium RYN_339]
MTDKDRLKRLIDELPDAAAGELLDFAEFLRAKQARAGMSGDQTNGPGDEDCAWLDADLSRMGEAEPYEWGDADPLAGETVSWDARAGAVIVGDGR